MAAMRLTAIQQAALAGIGLVDPDRCWHNLQPAYPSVIFSFRQASDETIINGIKALADAWEQFKV
jgi:GntR family transcriptional regulator/MocR family aminotransferase